MISLRRRSAWMMMGAAAGLILAALLGLGVAGMIIAAVLGAAAVALAVAANSCVRHSADPEIQPEYKVPVASRPGDHLH